MEKDDKPANEEEAEPEKGDGEKPLPNKRKRYRTRKRIKEENLDVNMPEVKVGKVFIDICEQTSVAKGFEVHSKHGV